MLYIPRSFLEEMIEHARSEVPRECCGLLSGKDGKMVTLHKLVNEAPEAEKEFFVASGLFEPYRRMRERDEEIIAIYHSHPSSAPVPSRKDIEQNYYPDAIHLIISLRTGEPEIMAYRIHESAFVTILWSIDESC